MEFTFKDFEQYYMTNLVSNIQIPEDKTIRRAFVFNDYVLIFRKCKKNYQVIQSGKCGFEPMFHYTTFDLLYQSTNENDSINMFLSYVERLITGVLHELYKSI